MPLGSCTTITTYSWNNAWRASPANIVENHRYLSIIQPQRILPTNVHSRINYNYSSHKLLASASTRNTKVYQHRHLRTLSLLDSSNIFICINSTPLLHRQSLLASWSKKKSTQNPSRIGHLFSLFQSSPEITTNKIVMILWSQNRWNAPYIVAKWPKERDQQICVHLILNWEIFALRWRAAFHFTIHNELGTILITTSDP